MIIVQPHSGLANRIRVIVSGINLAKRRSERLIVLWSKDDSLCCNFNSIFEISNNFKIINVTPFVRILNFIRQKIALRKLFCALFKINNYIVDADIPNFVWSTGTNNLNFEMLNNEKGNSYFYTCHEFYFDRELMKLLTPTKKIRDSIAKNVSLFSGNTIGIHIRRTDHTEAIVNSPIELFIEAINKEIIKDPTSKFFLATDDLQTELFLKQKFGNRIITSNKEFSRLSVSGIEGAMVDIYSLAATQKIYGSFYSSFSDIASRIGNIPLEIVKSN